MKKLLVVSLVLSLISGVVFGDELNLSIGSVTENNSSDNTANTFSIQDLVDIKGNYINFGYINEGHLPNLKRDGIFTEIYFPHQSSDKLSESIAIGPYLSTTTVTNFNLKSAIDQYNLNLLVGIYVKYNIYDKVNMVGQWQRVTTFSNTDTDLYLAGVSFPF